MKLHKLLSYLHSLFTYEGENPEITSIENDNRKVIDGSLFVCIKGYTVDGHDFAQLAVEHGAAAVIAERPLDLDVPVIVVRDSSRAMAVLADAFMAIRLKDALDRNYRNEWKDDDQSLIGKDFRGST